MHSKRFGSVVISVRETKMEKQTNQPPVIGMVVKLKHGKKFLDLE